MEKIKYARAVGFEGLPVIRLDDASAMLRLLKEAKGLFVFHQEDEDVFFFPHNGIAYAMAAEGFTALDDIKQAGDNDFPDAATYYEAKEKGCKTFAEYQMMTDAGVGDKAQLDKAQEGGFVAGFASMQKQWDVLRKKPTLKELPETCNSATELYALAAEKGFTAFEELEKALKQGFLDKRVYDDAQNKGFDNASDYYDAVKKGFDSAEVYTEAKKLMINTKAEWKNYKSFSSEMLNGHSHDEYQLLVALEAQPNGTKLDVGDVRDLLKKAQEDVMVAFEGESMKVLPLWYTTRLSDDEQLATFLTGGEGVEKVGSFNPEKKRFYIFKVSTKKVYVDGSNVTLYNSKRGVKKSGQLKDLLRVLDELNHRGFEDITIIADASLKHRIMDAELMKEVKKKATYYEVPANSDADEFLLKSVRKEACLLVSNDRFNDWKQKNNWAKKNIDNIRVPFMITKEGRVMLSGID